MKNVKKAEQVVKAHEILNVLESFGIFKVERDRNQIYICSVDDSARTVLNKKRCEAISETFSELAEFYKESDLIER